MKKQPPHVNVGGPKGVGKDTVVDILSSWYKTKKKRCATTRLRRKGESDDWLIFLEPEEFIRRMTPLAKTPDVLFDYDGSAEFSREIEVAGFDAIPDIISLSVHTIHEGGSTHMRGVLHSRLQPEPDPDTELIISIFNESTPYVKELFPEMINVFITANMKELERRLRQRCWEKHSGFMDQWLATLKYLRGHPEKDFQYVVSNNNHNKPEKCAAKIAKIAGLSLPAKVLR